MKKIIVTGGTGRFGEILKEWIPKMNTNDRKCEISYSIMKN